MLSIGNDQGSLILLPRVEIRGNGLYIGTLMRFPTSDFQWQPLNPGNTEPDEFATLSWATRWQTDQARSGEHILRCRGGPMAIADRD